MLATGMRIPKKGVLISLGSNSSKFAFGRKIESLLSLGLDVYATEGTYEVFKSSIQLSSSAIEGASKSDLHAILNSHLEFMEDGMVNSWNLDSTVFSNIERGKLKLAHKPSQDLTPNAVDLLKNGTVDLFINVANCVNSSQGSDGYQMRRAAIDSHTTLITTAKLALLTIDALIIMFSKEVKNKEFLENKSHSEYINL